LFTVAAKFWSEEIIKSHLNLYSSLLAASSKHA